MGVSLSFGNFSNQLILTKNVKTPVPAVDFANSNASVGGLFNQKQKIYVTPTEYFTTKYREIFTNTKIKKTTGKGARAWLGGPNIKYWSHHLNFALCCAITFSGISRDILLDMQLSSQLRGLFQFHVYFTIRRILFEMGSIQSVKALPGDPTFSQTNNPYDFSSYKRICSEFGVEPTTCTVSRFTQGKNHGFGYVYVIYDGGSYLFKKWTYPPATFSNPLSQRFADEQGAGPGKGTLLPSSETSMALVGSSNSLCQISKRAYTGRTVTFESVHRGLRVLCSWGSS